MGNIERTLVVLLSMHRCGSSLTANILQRLGMSLGPFEFLEATPSNPYGHFGPSERSLRPVDSYTTFS